MAVGQYSNPELGTSTASLWASWGTWPVVCGWHRAAFQPRHWPNLFCLSHGESGCVSTRKRSPWPLKATDSTGSNAVDAATSPIILRTTGFMAAKDRLGKREREEEQIKNGGHPGNSLHKRSLLLRNSPQPPRVFSRGNQPSILGRTTSRVVPYLRAASATNSCLRFNV